MTTVIIVVLLLAAMAAAIYSSVKHFRGQGGCCGGGSYRPRRKRLPQVKYRKVFRVTGMHCEHCRARVEEAINDIRGIAGRVDLRRGTLTVSYAEDVDDEVIVAKLARLGYDAAAVG